ncbi:uncharacterized protein [Parasteatoda tepidariorum]|uniref:uncharacterized protein n=1 Tax=Parasteatoda tepidariorum TaxID=114398 RepID=UPI001C721A37|nr:uncharacterized protein LOC107448265 [Parasteatoda tepidariorum]XP_042910418.1 uncharacterized protein LOC107448265 [Parasteatoda tepidariorum]XP_042910870.1 uncharacterized protein LOC107448265 [Parasteatoda tepidariorum]
MNQYLLLILLTSWSLVITHLEACDTGVAFTNSVLSTSRSSLANADVALLEIYTAQTVEKCMEDCCSGKYGDCTVVSYNKNATKKNCRLFNCRPLKQCKFVSSNTTDSFTFATGLRASHPVPSTQTLSTPKSSEAPTITSPNAKSHIEQPHAVEEIATYSDEQAGFKNDNKGVKPRKGVSAFTPDAILSKSGIKPRKGVTLEDVPHSKFLLKGLSKSSVKPRKGVEIETLINETLFYNRSSTTNNDSVSPPLVNSSNEVLNSEIESAFAKMFEDDPGAISAESSISATSTSDYQPTSSLRILATAAVSQTSSSEMESSFSRTPVASSNHPIQSSFTSTPSLVISSSILSSSEVMAATSTIAKSSPFVVPIASTVPLLSANTHISLEEPKSLDKSLDADATESESDRKYKSSIHVVLALVFGLLVLFAVLGVVAKRVYDSWQRRDYYRMNYLIDGVYNNYH